MKITRKVANRLLEIDRLFEEKRQKKEAIIARLSHIFGDDKRLAKTVYDYVFLSHLAYGGQLRDRFNK